MTYTYPPALQTYRFTIEPLKIYLVQNTLNDPDLTWEYMFISS